MFEKAAIISLNGAIADSDHSHRAHWPKLRRLQLLEAGWAEQIALQPEVSSLIGYDAVIYYWGIEFNGALNLYGGATNDNATRLATIAEIAKRKKIKTFCLDLEMPDIGALAAARTAPKNGSWGKTDWADVSKACAKVSPLWFQGEKHDKVVIGDSHSGSQYRPGWAVSRNDFKTLHGALEEGLINFVAPWARPKEITWYFGNIDLRHHLLRQPEPLKAVKELVNNYVDQVEEIRRRQGGVMEIVAPLPIEPETREIPKTGWYKGTPFYGSWSDRHALRDHLMRELRAACNRYTFALYEWPTWFITETGMLREKFMERPGSVHLSWAYRRHEITQHNNQEW